MPRYVTACLPRIYLHIEFHGELSNGLLNWEERKFGLRTADTQDEQEV